MNNHPTTDKDDFELAVDFLESDEDKYVQIDEQSWFKLYGLQRYVVYGPCEVSKPHGRRNHRDVRKWESWFRSSFHGGPEFARTQFLHLLHSVVPHWRELMIEPYEKIADHDKQNDDLLVSGPSSSRSQRVSTCSVTSSSSPLSPFSPPLSRDNHQLVPPPKTTNAIRGGSDPSPSVLNGLTSTLPISPRAPDNATLHAKTSAPLLDPAHLTSTTAHPTSPGAVSEDGNCSVYVVESRARVMDNYAMPVLRKSGIVYKQGNSTLISVWKERYLVLDGFLLKYLEDSFSVKPRAVVPLQRAVIEGLFSPESNALLGAQVWSFTLRWQVDALEVSPRGDDDPGPRVRWSFFHVGVSNHEEALSWLSAIEAAIRSCSLRPPPLGQPQCRGRGSLMSPAHGICALVDVRKMSAKQEAPWESLWGAEVNRAEPYRPTVLEMAAWRLARGVRHDLATPGDPGWVVSRLTGAGVLFRHAHDPMKWKLIMHINAPQEVVLKVLLESELFTYERPSGYGFQLIGLPVEGGARNADVLRADIVRMCCPVFDTGTSGCVGGGLLSSCLAGVATLAAQGCAGSNHRAKVDITRFGWREDNDTVWIVGRPVGNISAGCGSSSAFYDRNLDGDETLALGCSALGAWGFAGLVSCAASFLLLVTLAAVGFAGIFVRVFLRALGLEIGETGTTSMSEDDGNTAIAIDYIGWKVEPLLTDSAGRSVASCVCRLSVEADGSDFSSGSAISNATTPGGATSYGTAVCLKSSSPASSTDCVSKRPSCRSSAVSFYHNALISTHRLGVSKALHRLHHAGQRLAKTARRALKTALWSHLQATGLVAVGVVDHLRIIRSAAESASLAGQVCGIRDERALERQARHENLFSDPDDLNSSQRKALERLFRRFASFGLYHSDLLRFLIAEDWNFSAAEARLAFFLKWRRAHAIDALEARHVRYEVARHWAYVYGCDRYNRPCIVVKWNLHQPSMSNSEVWKQFIVYLVERAIGAMPNDVEQLVVLADCRKCFYANFDIKLLFELLPVLLTYYPERLGQVFVSGATPVVKVLWLIIKPFLPPSTANKVCFVPEEEEAGYLCKYFDKTRLPKWWQAHIST